MTNAGIKAVLKKARLEDEKLTADWLKFYLNVYLYVVIVVEAFAFPNALAGLSDIAIWIGTGNILELASFFVNALVGVAAVITFIELRDFTLAGYKWNFVLLCAGFAGNALSAFSKWLQEYAPGGLKLEILIGAQVAVALIWLIPNLIYFRKRKHLFRTYTTAEVAAALKGEPPAPVLPVRKPCHAAPTKMDMRKLGGKATRLRCIVGQRRKVQGR